MGQPGFLYLLAIAVLTTMLYFRMGGPNSPESRGSEEDLESKLTDVIERLKRLEKMR